MFASQMICCPNERKKMAIKSKKKTIKKSGASFDDRKEKQLTKNAVNTIKQLQHRLLDDEEIRNLDRITNRCRLESIGQINNAMTLVFNSLEAQMNELRRQVDEMEEDDDFEIEGRGGAEKNIRAVCTATT